VCECKFTFRLNRLGHVYIVYQLMNALCCMCLVIHDFCLRDEIIMGKFDFSVCIEKVGETMKGGSESRS
jgi:hypothetical protein